MEGRLATIESGSGNGGEIMNQILGQVDQYSSGKVNQLETTISEIQQKVGDLQTTLGGMQAALMTLTTEVERASLQLI